MKKALSAVLAAVLCIAFLACGSAACAECPVPCGCGQCAQNFMPCAAAYYGCGSVRVTKSPTGETVYEGGSASFISYAENSTGISWLIVNPNGKDFVDAAALAGAMPGLAISGTSSTTLTIGCIPLAFDGWYVQAKFYGPGGPVHSSMARLSVLPYPTYTNTKCPCCNCCPRVPGCGGYSYTPAWDCGQWTPAWNCGQWTPAWDCGQRYLAWDCGEGKPVWNGGDFEHVWNYQWPPVWDCGGGKAEWSCGGSEPVWSCSQWSPAWDCAS